MPWIALYIFSIVRFVGGIMFIIYTNNSSEVGWIIVAIILEGAGVIPLLLVLVGLIRLIHALDFPKNEKFRKSIILLRLIFLVGIGLLIAGSSLIGNYKDLSSVTLGIKLAKAGYLVFVFVLAVLVTFAGVLWLKMSLLCPDSKKVLLALFCSVPFLAVRMTFACLSVFDSNPKWSPLTGDIAPFVCMHSLMEYLVILICVTCGYSIQPTKNSAATYGVRDQLV